MLYNWSIASAASVREPNNPYSLKFLGCIITQLDKSMYNTCYLIDSIQHYTVWNIHVVSTYVETSPGIFCLAVLELNANTVSLSPMNHICYFTFGKHIVCALHQLVWKEYPIYKCVCFVCLIWCYLLCEKVDVWFDETATFDVSTLVFVNAKV